MWGKLVRSSCYVGYTALFKGVSPAMARGLTYGGLRIGMYTPIQDYLSDAQGNAGMREKVAAGCASGAIAAAITNPMELVRRCPAC
jgi:hypothetical protein